jgi:hypothetical protein
MLRASLPRAGRCCSFFSFFRAGQAWVTGMAIAPEHQKRRFVRR